MSRSWGNKLRRLRADVLNVPVFTVWTALLMIAISAGDLLEITPVFRPIVASRVFPFFHEIHDLLAAGVVLFVAYRKRTYLAYVSAMFYLVLHIPYFFLESVSELPEFLRIFTTGIIALLGVWLIDKIYGKLKRSGRKKGSSRMFSPISQSEGEKLQEEEQIR